MRSATIRPSVSGADPGFEPSTKVIGFSGYSASAGLATSVTPSPIITANLLTAERQFLETIT